MGLPYRPCVGIMMLNAQGNIFMGCRTDIPNAWQMPQGGIEEGEGVRDAALRELDEEIGTRQVTILGETAQWHTYEFPEAVVGQVYNGRYRGQRQKWVAALFTGRDNDINLNTAQREFAAWKWVPPVALLDQAPWFKKDVYSAVLREFTPLIEKLKESLPHE